MSGTQEDTTWDEEMVSDENLLKASKQMNDELREKVRKDAELQGFWTKDLYNNNEIYVYVSPE